MLCFTGNISKGPVSIFEQRSLFRSNFKSSAFFPYSTLLFRRIQCCGQFKTIIEIPQDLLLLLKKAEALLFWYLPFNFQTCVHSGVSRVKVLLCVSNSAIFNLTTAHSGQSVTSPPLRWSHHQASSGIFPTSFKGVDCIALALLAISLLLIISLVGSFLTFVFSFSTIPVFGIHFHKQHTHRSSK